MGIALDRFALVAELCSRISKGELVQNVALELGFSRQALYEWTRDDKALGDAYARARELQAHALAEEALAMADGAIGGKDGNVDKVRLQVDTRKWYTSKIAPRFYGERMIQEHTGPNGGPIAFTLGLAASAGGRDELPEAPQLPPGEADSQ